MKVLLTGATGFVGQEVCRNLFERGHDLVILSRNAERAAKTLSYPFEFYSWDPQNSPPPSAALRDIDAVINLMGESVAGERWSSSRKKKIVSSRVDATRQLVRALQDHTPKLKVFVSTSAIGYYGNRGDEVLDELSAPGQGFLADTCQAWEKATDSLPPTVRRVLMRLGFVLGRNGGGLSALLPAFQAGLGGPIGGGHQWMSWIHLDDVVALFTAAIEQEAFEGPVNATAPQPVTNRTFAQMLGRACGRPAFFPIPGFALRLLMGEASAVALDSQRVHSRISERVQFRFRFEDCQSALNDIMKDLKPWGTRELIKHQWVPHPPIDVFPFFSAAKNLEKLTPPWLNFQVKSTSTPSIQDGTEISYRLKIHGFPATWVSQILNWAPPTKFVDIQIKGPYKLWYHTHGFRAVRGGTLLSDHVLYRLPFFPWSLPALPMVKRDVESIFSYRSKQIQEMFRPKPL